MRQLLECGVGRPLEAGPQEIPTANGARAFLVLGLWYARWMRERSVRGRQASPPRKLRLGLRGRDRPFGLLPSGIVHLYGRKELVGGGGETTLLFFFATIPLLWARDVGVLRSRGCWFRELSV